MKGTDIDIDIADRNVLLKHIKHVPASMINNETIREHNVGIYLQDIPTFLNTGMASIDYKDAGKYGFFKLDILNNSVYEDIRDEAHLDFLLSAETDWSLLHDDNVISSLFQIHNYGKYLKYWKPDSEYRLAMFIAMIRPAKMHLLTKETWEEVEKEIWIKPTDDKHYFKKSHSVAYANVIKIQLNLIKYG